MDGDQVEVDLAEWQQDRVVVRFRQTKRHRWKTVVLDAYDARALGNRLECESGRAFHGAPATFNAHERADGQDPP